MGAKLLAQSQGSWLFLFPVTNLRLTDAVHEEFGVDRVAFATVRRLARVRRRLGIPKRISEIRAMFNWMGFLDDPDQVVAVAIDTGEVEDAESRTRRLVTEALQLVAASQLGYAKRRSNSFPAIDGAHWTRTQHLCLNVKTNEGMGSAQVLGKFREMTLDGRWLNFQKQVYFWDLMRVLRGEVRVDKAWKQTLHRVALLIGQSQTSEDLAHAFMLNMIAVEALLAVQGDKYFDALPERVEAFIGWIGYWKTRNYENRIRDLYAKRCKYVHEGDSSGITVPDLLFLDDVVLNLIVNIVGHPRVFKNKNDVVDFSKRVAAERLLGIEGKRSQARPKTLRHFAPNYSVDDQLRI